MQIFSFLFKLLPIQTVYAHCDIPCGIYDPHTAQMAAHTVIRMTQLIAEAKDDMHAVARMTHIKEEHGEKVEDELNTLENDYFKDEHVAANPTLPDLIKKAIKASIKARQEVNMEVAKEALETVMQIAEIFYKTKGMESVRIKAPYPTGLEIVVPKG